MVVGFIKKKTRKKKKERVVEVTGISHNRRFKVKWSDGIQTEEAVRGLSIPGSVN